MRSCSCRAPARFRGKFGILLRTTLNTIKRISILICASHNTKKKSQININHFFYKHFWFIKKRIHETHLSSCCCCDCLLTITPGHSGHWHGNHLTVNNDVFSNSIHVASGMFAVDKKESVHYRPCCVGETTWLLGDLYLFHFRAVFWWLSRSNRKSQSEIKAKNYSWLSSLADIFLSLFCLVLHRDWQEWYQYSITPLTCVVSVPFQAQTFRILTEKKLGRANNHERVWCHHHPPILWLQAPVVRESVNAYQWSKILQIMIFFRYYCFSLPMICVVWD